MMIAPLRIYTAAAFLTALTSLTGLTASPLPAQLPAPPVSAQAPLSLGGYGTLTARLDRGNATNRDAELHEAAAAVLVSGTAWRWLSYFAEIEAASVSRETFTGREERRWLEAERAYVELAASDPFRLRIGRFLTPFGQWNEIHAEPLTWTAARPLTSFRPFAKSTNGAMLTGQMGIGSSDAGYALWVAPHGFDPEGEGEESAFVRAAGGRFAIELRPDLYVGMSGAGLRASRRRGEDEPDEDDEEEEERLSLLRAGVPARTHEPGHLEDDPESEDPDDPDEREEDAETRALLGVDLSWTIHGVHLLSEVAWLGDATDHPAELGAFVQAAVPLVESLHLTARAERYDPVVDRALRIYTAGLNWRPVSRLTLKLERQLTDRPSRRVVNGWLVSVSGLF